MRYKERDNVLRFKLLWSIRLGSGEITMRDILLFLREYHPECVKRELKRCMAEQLVDIDRYGQYYLTEAGERAIREHDKTKHVFDK